MTTSFGIQYRAGAEGWQQVEEPPDGKKRDPKPLLFKSRGKAEKAALEFSTLNDGLFRVVGDDEAMTGSYIVFAGGKRLVQTATSMLAYPESDTDLLTLMCLIAPDAEELARAHVSEPATQALGQLIARWARCRPEQLRKVHVAALAAAEEGSIC